MHHTSIGAASQPIAYCLRECRRSESTPIYTCMVYVTSCVRGRHSLCTPFNRQSPQLIALIYPRLEGDQTCELSHLTP